MLILLILLSLALPVHAKSASFCAGVLGAFVPAEEEVHQSVAGISILEGQVNLWSQLPNESANQNQLQLQLEPDNPAIIGRAEGRRPPYLAKGYTPTTLLLGGGRVVSGNPNDTLLSRAHFMLKHSPQGILVVNGVPAESGGIRTPKNGTMLLSPESRPMKNGEEYLIEKGSSAKIRLPNGAILLINAE